MRYQYPLSLTFKITTLSSDFSVTDVHDNQLFYVRQKMFKLREELTVSRDSSEAQKLYTIKANQWLDFSASYGFVNAAGEYLGSIARKGWASIFKAHYDVFDAEKQHCYTIREENAWIKVLDGIFGDIPIIGLLSGYVFNPAYLVTDHTQLVAVRLVKQPSLLGRRFKLEKMSGFRTAADEERVLLALSMLLMLERQRG